MRRNFKWISLLAVLSLILYACGDGTGDDGANGDNGTTVPSDDGTTVPSDDGGDDGGSDVYYEDKVIRFITTSGSGGGTDLKVRTLASQLPRFIPGNPASQVSNVTPHVAGMNFLWESEPDGLTVGLTAAPTLEFEFFEESNWDSSEWTYIGAIDAACDNMLLVRGDLGYETIEDAMGSDGPTLITMTQAPTPADVEPVALATMLIADYLDLPLEVRRVAESGQGALNLAMERGEINFARYGASWCLLPEQNPTWLEDGFLIPLLDVATRSSEAQMAEGVENRPPHVSDVLTEEQYAEFVGLVSASREGGNTIFMPPDVPEETAEILRTAFNEAIEDEDFVEAMMGAFGGSDLAFLTADEIDAIATANLETMTQYSDRFEEVAAELFEKYVK